MLEDFLPLVAKPGRYIDSEINAVRKELSTVKTKVCLFFPDTYEVGMSHLGLRILYHILNSRQDTACERVFSPWTDYELRLRASGRPLTSLESNVPLAEFDIIGVTLQYELSYTNILTGLDLAKIPLRAADRAEHHPVVMAGGPCSVNPGPLAAFMDAFFIGEAEEAVHEMVELRQRHRDRSKFLEALSQVEGFYVPQSGKRPVQRRALRDIESAPYPDRPLVPLMKPVHDRITVEVARGCLRGCRYCQAGMIYRPYRERSQETIKGLIHESLRCTGYDELSLSSLSSGDYSAIEPLMTDLLGRYQNDRVSISLPSLRIGTLTPGMIRAVAGVRKAGFTLAPEAGTERLRAVINKAVSDLDLLDAAETIFKSGWNVLKLYFMIGLPTETDEDLDGVIRLCRDLTALGKRAARRPVQLNVSVSTFVPKPHTPFQWYGQIPLEEIKRRQAYLDQGLRRRGVTLKPHMPEMSLLEAAFSRGDDALSLVIAKAVELGCRFDGWTETFDFGKWTEAFRACGLDVSAYASRSFALDEELPWDFVNTGVTRAFFKREYERALKAEVTENCRVQCEGCGMKCKDGGKPSLGVPSPGPAAHAAPEAREERTKQAVGPEFVTRIRLKYTKTGRLRFLSHLDFMVLVHRAVARAGIPVAYSQGFNPHPKMAFGPPLAVGMESEAEYLDMETDPFVDLLEVVKALNSALPEGVRILEARVIPKKAPSLSGSISRYVYSIAVPAQRRDGLGDRIETFLGQKSIVLEKEGKRRDIRPAIESIAEQPSADGVALVVTLQDSVDVRARVQEVAAKLFELTHDETALLRITRTAVLQREGDRWVSPMEM